MFTVGGMPFAWRDEGHREALREAALIMKGVYSETFEKYVPKKGMPTKEQWQTAQRHACDAVRADPVCRAALEKALNY